MPSKPEERPEVKFARGKLAYVLGAFILGLLCTTHPIRYFEDPRDDRDRDDRKHKSAKRNEAVTKEHRRRKPHSVTNSEPWPRSNTSVYEDDQMARPHRIVYQGYPSDACSYYPEPRSHFTPMLHRS